MGTATNNQPTRAAARATTKPREVRSRFARTRRNAATATSPKNSITEARQLTDAKRAWPDRIRDLVRDNVARMKTVNAMNDNGRIEAAAMMAQTAAMARSDIVDAKRFIDVGMGASSVG